MIWLVLSHSFILLSSDYYHLTEPYYYHHLTEPYYHQLTEPYYYIRLHLPSTILVQKFITDITYCQHWLSLSSTITLTHPMILFTPNQLLYSHLLTYFFFTLQSSDYTFDYLSAELDKDIQAHLTVVRNRRNFGSSSSSSSGSGIGDKTMTSVHLVGESFGGVIAQW